MHERFRAGEGWGRGDAAETNKPARDSMGQPSARAGHRTSPPVEIDGTASIRDGWGEEIPRERGGVGLDRQGRDAAALGAGVSERES